MLKANNLVANNEEFMEMDIDMYVEHLDYLREQGKYPEETRNWILPLKKKDKTSYLERVLKAKGLWQDKK